MCGTFKKCHCQIQKCQIINLAGTAFSNGAAAKYKVTAIKQMTVYIIYNISLSLYIYIYICIIYIYICIDSYENPTPTYIYIYTHSLFCLLLQLYIWQRHRLRMPRCQINNLASLYVVVALFESAMKRVAIRATDEKTTSFCVIFRCTCFWICPKS